MQAVHQQSGPDSSKVEQQIGVFDKVANRCKRRRTGLLEFPAFSNIFIKTDEVYAPSLAHMVSI